MAEEIDLQLNKWVLPGRCSRSTVLKMYSLYRYKADTSEITRTTGVGDINDLSQM